jgi:hypothetical protein
MWVPRRLWSDQSSVASARRLTSAETCWGAVSSPERASTASRMAASTLSDSVDGSRRWSSTLMAINSCSGNPDTGYGVRDCRRCLPMRGGSTVDPCPGRQTSTRGSNCLPGNRRGGSARLAFQVGAPTSGRRSHVSAGSEPAAPRQVYSRTASLHAVRQHPGLRMPRTGSRARSVRWLSRGVRTAQR